MCQNANKTASSLMAAIEPTLKSLLLFTGKLNTPEGQAALRAYDVALIAVQNWHHDTPIHDVLEILGDFQMAFNAVFPEGDTTIPANVKMLVNIILAGVVTVIGVIEANSPAPPAPKGLQAHAETQAMHQATVIHDTTVMVTTLVPTFKQSKWHSPESQYRKAWNDAVAKVPGVATL